MFIPIIYTVFSIWDASANRILSYAVEMAKFGMRYCVMSLVTYDQPFTDKEREDLMRCSAPQRDKCTLVSGAIFAEGER